MAEKKERGSVTNYLSKLGQSLMLPIAALSVVGLLLGLMSALTKDAVVAAIPAFAATEPVGFVFATIKSVASAVYSQIPALFAICLALGLAKKDKEIAAFSGFVGYYTFLAAGAAMVNSGLVDFSSLDTATVLGIEGVPNMSAFGGIIVGCLTAALHDRFIDTKLPVAISFYGGKRSVAIVVFGVMLLLGIVSPFVWLPLSVAINALGAAIASLGNFGVFLFGLAERGLIPTGLHHIINQLFRTTEIGGTLGDTVGALNIFYANVDTMGTAALSDYTRYLAEGKFPFMLFGLPGAALAIYKAAPAERRDSVKALMIAGAVTAFVSGITEPLEFTFLFAAPALYAFHSVMAGLSFMIVHMLGVSIGGTGGGIIDFFIWGVLQPGSNWFLVIPVGVVYFFVYYFVFYKYLTTKHVVIDAPDDSQQVETTAEVAEGTLTPQLTLIIEGLGGVDNIVNINNCITRLRVDVKDMDQIDEDMLKKSGAMGIKRMSDTHVHVIYGPAVENIATQLHSVLKM
ncbi:MAG: PTS transporter subunit EIIC [Tractidigestivibacter sp.]|uniref:PTS transporter subunit EIIC n=1 Tax=Tractidigestivibacter sp. TaxID=2847320 RepID=UPI003D8F0440